jgi:anthranilate phosphoribosyltransferase
LIVFGHDGLDELTTTDTSTVLEYQDGTVRTYVVDPVELGLSKADKSELLGAEAGRNAALARRVLGGEIGPHRDIVILNAAAGIVAAGEAADLVDGMIQAADAIDGGEAERRLLRLAEVSRAESGS